MKGKITSWTTLERAAEDYGLLPFFDCGAGLSVQELTPERYWFAGEVEGPWEWRMEVARRGTVAYGKLFNKKAGLVSREWYPDLANYRRRGYDFDARYEDGLADHREKCIMDVLLGEGPMLSKDLKRAAGFDRGGLKGFDAAITRLQMETYVTVHSFEYSVDKLGRPYGWGVAKYAVSEDVLGEEVTRGAYGRDPRESKARLIDRLGLICPDAYDDELERLIR